MPVLTRVEELPEFNTAHTDFLIAQRDAGDDETAKLRAQLAWSDKQRELERTMVQRNESSRAIDQAMARVREQYASVPEHIYAGGGTPEEIEQRAKDFHDAVQAQVAAATPTPPTSPGTTGQPPTGVNPGQSGATDLEGRLRELAPQVKRRAYEPGANEEFQNLMINGIVAPAMLNAKRVAGGVR